MQPVFTHDWPRTKAAAIDLQAELAAKVRLRNVCTHFDLIAGADVAYNDQTEQLVAAIVILDAQTLTMVDHSTHVSNVDFPYISGLFSFRELPPLIAAAEKLGTRPDVMICDGQGIAHPRRFGLASHFGVTFDLPTIGCAKTHLFGNSEPPATERGSWSSIKDGDDQIGAVLRTQDNVKPLYISPGHAISLKTSIDLVLAACGKYRQPETTRTADQLVRQVMKTLQ